MGLELTLEKRLESFSFEVRHTFRPGTITAVVGPSGAGKTTLVRLIAGLERPDAGVVRCAGELWSDAKNGHFLSPQKRKLGYVFQEYSLFPHLSLRRNVHFAATDKELADSLIQRFGLWERRKAKPAKLSGGERQRTALAQALATSPRALLLDEPFSALDAVTRNSLHEELMRLRQDFAIPIILVTHDLEEALALGDEVVSIKQGRLDPNWLETALAARIERMTRFAARQPGWRDWAESCASALAS